jgi:hypothetical protein
MTIEVLMQILPFSLLAGAVFGSYLAARGILIPLLRKAAASRPVWDDMLPAANA